MIQPLTALLINVLRMKSNVNLERFMMKKLRNVFVKNILLTLMEKIVFPVSSPTTGMKVQVLVKVALKIQSTT